MMSRRLSALRLGRERADPVERMVADETPVAIEFNGIGYAVMMMTPADLPAFALGFALTERVIRSPDELLDVDIAAVPAGLILRLTVGTEAAARIGDRIRHRTSDTGCGLCGIAGLEALYRPLPPPPPPPRVTRAGLFAALDAIRVRQHLNAETGAVHAAAWCDADGAIVTIAEDVGRHNALDKLIGLLGGGAPVDGFALITSRVSFEMVDKALVARVPLLAGVSAATGLAIDHARAHDLTLVALARSDAMLVFSDPAGVFVRNSTD